MSFVRHRFLGPASARVPLFSPGTPGGLRVLQTLAAAALVLSLALPVQGFGFSICIFYNLTGLPCPGCGLTRSMISVGHWELWHSLRYHPLGLVAYAIAVTLALSGWFSPLARFFVRQQRAVAKAAFGVGVLFLLAGALRLVAVLYRLEGLTRFTVFVR